MMPRSGSYDLSENPLGSTSEIFMKEAKKPSLFQRFSRKMKNNKKPPEPEKTHFSFPDIIEGMNLSILNVYIFRNLLRGKQELNKHVSRDVCLYKSNV